MQSRFRTLALSTVAACFAAGMTAAVSEFVGKWIWARNDFDDEVLIAAIFMSIIMALFALLASAVLLAPAMLAVQSTSRSAGKVWPFVLAGVGALPILIPAVALFIPADPSYSARLSHLSAQPETLLPLATGFGAAGSVFGFCFGSELRRLQATPANDRAGVAITR